MRPWLRSIGVEVSDGCGLVGFVGLEYGLWQVWPPMAWVVGGGLLLGVAVWSWTLERPKGPRR